MKYYLAFIFVCSLYPTPAFSQKLEADSLTLFSKKEQIKMMKTEHDALKKNIETLEKEIKELSTPSKYFDQGLFTYANFSQSQFVNWLAGGENSISFVVGADYVLAYRDRPKKISWDTKASGMLGYRNDQALGLVKANDLLTINSNFGYAILPKWSLAGDFYLVSQFLETEEYPSDGKRVVASSLFSPANINLGVGVRWNPLAWVSAYISPLTSKSVIVANRDVDPIRYGMDSGQRFRMEAGWSINAEATKKIFSEAVAINARCILFQNYIVARPDNFIDVDFRLKIDAKISKYFYATLFLNLRYDGDDKLSTSVTENGITTTNYSPAGLQLYENLGIGFSYKLDRKY